MNFSQVSLRGAAGQSHHQVSFQLLYPLWLHVFIRR
jgi:hypothetical protein